MTYIAVMRGLTAVNTSFTAHDPLADAEGMKRNALAVLVAPQPAQASVPLVGGKRGASAPIVAANDSRRTRAFSWGTDLRPSYASFQRFSATRFFRERSNTMATNAAATQGQRMASAMLGASSGRHGLGAPTVTALSMLRAQVAHKRFIRAWQTMRSNAQLVVDTLAARFRQHTYDMVDGRADMPATVLAKARGWQPQRLPYA